jgi:hypothetical protein
VPDQIHHHTFLGSVRHYFRFINRLSQASLALAYSSTLGRGRKDGYHDDFFQRIDFVPFYPGGVNDRKEGHDSPLQKPCQDLFSLFFIYADPENNTAEH